MLKSTKKSWKNLSSLPYKTEMVQVVISVFKRIKRIYYTRTKPSKKLLRDICFAINSKNQSNFISLLMQNWVWSEKQSGKLFPFSTHQKLTHINVFPSRCQWYVGRNHGENNAINMLAEWEIFLVAAVCLWFPLEEEKWWKIRVCVLLCFCFAGVRVKTYRWLTHKS